MDTGIQQRLQDVQGDGRDTLRQKLLRVIEFHEIVGREMRHVGSCPSHATMVAASNRVMSCLRHIAKDAANKVIDDEIAAEDERDDELAAAGAGDTMEKAVDISKQSLALFDDMMVLYLDMKSQRDAMMIAAFAILALAVYAFWR